MHLSQPSSITIVSSFSIHFMLIPIAFFFLSLSLRASLCPVNPRRWHPHLCRCAPETSGKNHAHLSCRKNPSLATTQLASHHPHLLPPLFFSYRKSMAMKSRVPPKSRPSRRQSRKPSHRQSRSRLMLWPRRTRALLHPTSKPSSAPNRRRSAARCKLPVLSCCQST